MGLDRLMPEAYRRTPEIERELRDPLAGLDAEERALLPIYFYVRSSVHVPGRAYDADEGVLSIGSQLHLAILDLECALVRLSDEVRASALRFALDA